MLFLRETWSHYPKAEGVKFPWIALTVILVLAALVVLVIYLFRHRLDEFIKLSDADAYAKKTKKKKKSGTSSTATRTRTQTVKTQTIKSLGYDPARTTSMKVENKNETKEDKGE